MQSAKMHYVISHDINIALLDLCWDWRWERNCALMNKNKHPL